MAKGKKKRGVKTPRKPLWKRVKAYLHKVPHLFAKVTIIYCIICATLASAYALRAQAAGMSMAEVLAIVLGFFGGELMLLCLKTILKKEDKNNESASDEPSI